MNFYFCETCGKRLTEADLEEGRGKNKKLKGVYCSGCAAGVMTMETLPVVDPNQKTGNTAPAKAAPQRSPRSTAVLFAARTSERVHDRTGAASVGAGPTATPSH